MKLLFIFGTRPEAIKLAPLIIKAKERSDVFNVRVCVTGQHKEMLHQVLSFFNIKCDYDLSIMLENQSLCDITKNALGVLDEVVQRERADLVLVQGDTTTAFVGALTSFYNKIPVAHVEAGLRSHNISSPFPEEMNRLLIGDLAYLHFAPTEKAKENLVKEGKKIENIYTVGNTVIDALFMTLDLIKKQEDEYAKHFDFIDFAKKIILVTSHRRENFGEPFKEICSAIKELANRDDVEIIYPLHLNPKIKEPATKILSGIGNVHLITPLDYPHLVWTMSKSYIILTDSGGIQEEAPSLGKPVLVMRSVTERIEGVEAGNCLLVGYNRSLIIKEVFKLLDDGKAYENMSKKINPYGDGKSSDRILQIIR